MSANIQYVLGVFHGSKKALKGKKNVAGQYSNKGKTALTPKLIPVLFMVLNILIFSHAFAAAQINLSLRG